MIYDNLCVGGVQTLIVRLSAALAARGWQVAVLVRREGDAGLEGALPGNARLWRGSFRRGTPAPGGFRPERVLAFDPVSLNAAAARYGGQQNTRIGVWVLHPREFAARLPRRRWRDRVAAELLRALPAANVAFMNGACAAEHAAALGDGFKACPVVPLPVETARYAAAARSFRPGRLITVGRLTPFKTYHRWMPEVLARLRARHPEVTYDVYGDGAERAALAAEIRARGLEQAVRLHGAVPYASLAEIFAGAWAFVGMGTALAEAAAAGLPALVVPESVPAPASYGFFHEGSGYELGEFEPGRRADDPAARLSELFAARFYARAAAAGRLRAAGFATERVVPQLEDWLARLEPARLTLPPLYAARDLADSAARRCVACLGLPEADALRHVWSPPPARAADAAAARPGV